MDTLYCDECGGDAAYIVADVEPYENPSIHGRVLCPSCLEDLKEEMEDAGKELGFL